MGAGLGGGEYAELHCHSNFSFLDGASHPEELAEEAARLELAALALTDHDGFYGVVRFAEAARVVSLPTVFGSELTLLSGSGSSRTAASAPRTSGIPDPAGEHLIVLAQGPVGYSRLAKAISEAQLAGEKGARRARRSRNWPTRRARRCISRATSLLARTTTGSCSRVVAREACRPRCNATVRRPRSGPWPSWWRCSAATVCSWSCGTTAIRSIGTATMHSCRSRCSSGWKWSRPTTCTTPRPRAVSSRPRSPRCVRAAHSTRSTAGSPRGRSHTCAARTSNSAGSRGGRVPSNAPSKSPTRVPST